MNKEDKQLLLKDLCARLPYGIKAQVKYPINTNGEYIITTKEITSVNCGLDIVQAENIDIIVGYYIFEVKPYLFPLSSMTEEQEEEISKRYNYHNYYEGLCIEITKHSEGYWDDNNSCHLQDYLWLEDWFNKNHFDYRGLIPMGLAKDATGLNIY